MGKGGDDPPDSAVQRYQLYPELQGEYGRAITEAENLYRRLQRTNPTGFNPLEQEGFDLTRQAATFGRGDLVNAADVANRIAGGSNYGGPEQAFLQRAMTQGAGDGGIVQLRNFARGGGIGAGGQADLRTLSGGGGVGTRGQGDLQLLSGGGGVGPGGNSTLQDIARQGAGVGGQNGYAQFAAGGGVGPGGTAGFNQFATGQGVGRGGTGTIDLFAGGGGVGQGGQAAYDRYASGQGVGAGGQQTFGRLQDAGGVGTGGQAATGNILQDALRSNFGTDYTNRTAEGAYLQGNPFRDRVLQDMNQQATEEYRRAVSSLEGRLSAAGVAGGSSGAELDLRSQSDRDLANRLYANSQNTLFADYENERQRQQQAGLAAPGQQLGILQGRLGAAGQLDDQSLARAGLQLQAGSAAEAAAQGRAGIGLQGAAGQEQGAQFRAGLRFDAGQAQDQAALQRAGLSLQGIQGQEQSAQARAGLRLQGIGGQEQGALARSGLRLGAGEALNQDALARAGLRLNAAGQLEQGDIARGNLRLGAAGQLEDSALGRAGLGLQGALGLENATTTRFGQQLGAAQAFGAGRRADTAQQLQAAGMAPGLFSANLGAGQALFGLGQQQREANQQPFSNFERYLSTLQGLGGISNPQAGAAALQNYQSGGQRFFGNTLGLLGTGASIAGLFTGNPALAAGGYALGAAGQGQTF